MIVISITKKIRLMKLILLLISSIGTLVKLLYSIVCLTCSLYFRRERTTVLNLECRMEM